VQKRLKESCILKRMEAGWRRRNGRGEGDVGEKKRGDKGVDTLWCLDERKMLMGTWAVSLYTVLREADNGSISE